MPKVIDRFCWSGYLGVSRTISGPFLCELREVCASLCTGRLMDSGEAVTESFAPNRPILAALVQHGAAQLHDMGLTGLRYLSGAIIPKYAGEGMRAYHVDWWAWHDPVTREEMPAVVGLIFYLDRASERNGALVVIPGSHRRRVVNHFQIFGSARPWRDHSTTIEAQAGDAILIDTRLLHGTEANTTRSLRLAVTVFYLVGWERLSERIQASAALMMDASWHQVLGDLYPDYTGTAEPWPHDKRPYFQESQ